MAFEINKVLVIPVSPIKNSIDLKILEAVEQVVKNRVFSVDYQELKAQKPGTRRFLIKRALNHRDK